MYNIGDRFQIDGEVATVKFVGHIEPWGTSLALGLEWDNSSRGKNDGDVAGKKYFDVTISGSGSFMKADSKKIKPRKTFDQALIEMYGIEDNQINDEISFGSKIAENYGFDKLNTMNANFYALKSISMDKRGIYCCGEVPDLKNLTRLDLSGNLFNDIDEIWKIVNQLPQLKELNINGNKITRYSDDKMKLSPHGLEVLKLSATNLPCIQILHILKQFPNLRELSLSDNNINDTDVNYISSQFGRIDYLDLSFNRLMILPSLNAKNLNVINNSINKIQASPYYYQQLDIRQNDIKDWKFVDQLYSWDNLEHLRINDNPLFAQMEEEEEFINVIARINTSKLKTLNGSVLMPKEIENAELYFINKVKLGQYQVDVNSGKWKFLVDKYNVDYSTEEKHKPVNDFAHRKIEIKVYDDDKLLLTRNFLNDSSILRVKGTISKRIKLSILRFKVYYYLINDTRQYLDDDVSRLEDFNFEGIQNLYIETL